MNFLAFLLGLCALEAVADQATSTPIVSDLRYTDFGNPNLNFREDTLLKLVEFTLQPTTYEDIKEVAKNFVFAEKLDKFDNKEAVQYFVDGIAKGNLLSQKTELWFGNKAHKIETIKTFQVLYSAHDFETFAKAACWFRENSNRKLFIQALTTAVMHRKDCRGIIFPSPLIISSIDFIEDAVIRKAYDIKKSRFYRMKHQYNSAYVINSPSQEMNSEPSTLNYFTEDIGLNNYYYNFALENPSWLLNETEILGNNRVGEQYYFMSQQLLARYNLERLSHGKCELEHHAKEIAPYIFHVPEDYGGPEQMVKDYGRLHYLESLGRMVFKNLQDHQTSKLKPNTYLTRFLQKPPISIFWDLIFPSAKKTGIPLGKTEFWTVLAAQNEIFKQHYNLQPPYSADSIIFPEVLIKNIQVNNMTTYVDLYHIDVTNAVLLNDDERKRNNADFSFLRRSQRINHEPFAITLEVGSDVYVQATIRIFLGPKYDCFGNIINISENRLNFVELDVFVQDLIPGLNVITRRSLDFSSAAMEYTLMNNPWSTVNSSAFPSDYWVNLQTKMPHWLLLPMGHEFGFKAQLMAIVTPLQRDSVGGQFEVPYRCRNGACIDTLPLGFPLDKKIKNLTIFKADNIFFKDVSIYHKVRHIDPLYLANSFDVNK